MTEFKNGQRVRITGAAAEDYGAASGTVVRLRRCDYGAWVNLDDEPAPDQCSFPVGDPRRNHVLLFPDDCEAL